MTTIGEKAFNGCANLTAVTIPNSVTTIVQYAFYASGLTAVSIPSGVTTIDNNTFYNCSSLTEVVIPDNVTSIGQYAFGASGLTSVTIPSTVESIGAGAFNKCASLTTVTVKAESCTLGNVALGKCTSLTAIYVPSGKVEYYQGATNWSAYADIIKEKTYTVTLAEGTVDADNWEISPTEAAEGKPITATYNGKRHVKSVTAVVKAAAPAVTYPLLSAATTADYGKVMCAARHLHDAKTALPDGCTAVGIIGKVTETGHGLILALQDATWQTWNTINGWASETTYAGTTLKVLPDEAARGSLTSYTKLGETTVSNWAVAQKSDYEAIFTNLGSTTGDSDGLAYDANVNAFITTGVGGSALYTTNSDGYWSATEHPNDSYGWCLKSCYWNYRSKDFSIRVRPVLGF